MVAYNAATGLESWARLVLIILHDASWPTWTQPQQKDAARNVPIRPKPKHLDCLDLRLDRKNQGGELSRERRSYTSLATGP